MTELRNVGLDGRNLGTGIGRYTRELLTALAIHYPQTTWHLIVNNDSPVVELEGVWRRPPNVVIKTVTATHYSLAEQTRLGRELDALSLDVMHFTNFNLPATMTTPVVATVHDLTLLFFPGRRMWPGKRWFYKRVMANTLRRSRQIITASTDALRDIKQFARTERIPAIAAKLHCIPHGVSATFLTKLKRADVTTGLADLSLVNPYFLVVGGQLPHKNVHQVARAFADLIKDDAYRAYKLVIAGRRTAPAPLLSQALRNSRLEDRVVFTGPVSDNELRILYHGATALVFASLKEGFGLPIIEAFACGCPVIASRVSSIPEVARSAAWYVDPQVPATITAQMKLVVSEPKRVVAKVKLGAERVKRYNWEQTAKETYRVYCQASQTK